MTTFNRAAALYLNSQRDAYCFHTEKLMVYSSGNVI